MTFGRRLQQVRKAAGLSQEQLAELVGMSRQAVSKWETDQAAPDVDKLALLCGVLGVSADELLGREAPPQRGGLEDCVRMNGAKRCFTAGWVTALVGVVLLVAELFSLIVIQFVDAEVHHSWRTNAMGYAQDGPMPVIFGVTIAAVAAGVLMAAGGLLSMSGKRPVKRPRRSPPKREPPA